MGPRMDLAYQGYRQVLCGNYRIIYELISVKRIEVAYIRHLSRQIGLRAV
jgi:plasmid stabilization system protein ParE